MVQRVDGGRPIGFERVALGTLMIPIVAPAAHESSSTRVLSRVPRSRYASIGPPPGTGPGSKGTGTEHPIKHAGSPPLDRAGPADGERGAGEARISAEIAAKSHATHSTA